jgi:hypothetical protein
MEIGRCQVVVPRFRRLLLERVQIFAFVLEVLLVEAAQRLAVLTGLVRATMSAVEL